ncbi:di-heme oxidoredictase family protein [Tundrisphaera lichenicola]|uniref:di-heme oxidoredictase family protein n=1 Tax=Tundrisphaera lichenicola TaxID=2029860 RepID=UPI003EBB0668
MASFRRIRPAHLIALVLIVPPIYKIGERFWPAPSPVKVDARAVAAGSELFHHQWKINDPLSSGDGLGPIFNARSCVECHFQGGPGGGGPVENNVTIYGASPSLLPKDKSIPPLGVIHSHATRPDFQERLNLVLPGLPGTPSIELERLVDPNFRCTIPSGVLITQRNTPALFGDGLLDAISEDLLYAEQRRNSSLARIAGLSRAKDPSVRGRVVRMADGRVGRFGWKAEFASLDDFVRAACANELGLSNPSRKQATSLAKPEYQAQGIDLSEAQCSLMTDYLRDLPAPVQVLPSSAGAIKQVQEGSATFSAIGCADCHTPDLGTMKGFYSNLLIHEMGSDLASSNGYNGDPPSTPGFDDEEGVPPSDTEWRTPPLWGVADSAPYLHDGRAKTLDEAIVLHGGEALNVVERYKKLPSSEQRSLIAFLETFRAPSAISNVPALATSAH